MTIGHSDRSLEQLVALLRRHRVARLVDVRAHPGSRRLPQFGHDVLAATLPEHEVDYQHHAALGGRRRATHDAPEAWGGAWRNGSFRAYAQYAQSAEYRAALDELLRAAQGRRTAIMCSEAVPWRCHRWLVSDTLVARGVDVWHVIGSGAPRAHQPSPFARFDDGDVRWPGPPSDARLALGPPPGVSGRR